MKRRRTKFPKSEVAGALKELHGFVVDTNHVDVSPNALVLVFPNKLLPIDGLASNPPEFGACALNALEVVATEGALIFIP